MAFARVLLVIVAAASVAGHGAADAPETQHLVERTVVEVGRSRFIGFRAAVAEADRTLAAESDHPERLRILVPPSVLAGETLGWCRVAGLATGRVTLRIGGVPLAIDVIPPRSGGAPERPTLVSPGPGAVLWGDAAASVELLDPPDPLGRAPAAVWLELPDGRRLEPAESTDRAEGPTRRFGFRLPGGTLATGPAELRPVAVWPDGTSSHGDPVLVRWIEPPADRLLHWEGEAPNTRPRPQRWGAGSPPVAVDSRCSGGRCAANFGPYPPVCVEVPVPAGGAWYQMMAGAAAHAAFGALPTVGVHVDEAPEPVTNGRLAAERLHRAAVGVPFFLAEGDHLVVPLFGNDFSSSRRSDRNLFLDYVELVRLDGPAARTGARSAGMRAAGTMMEGADMARMGPAMTPGGAPVASTATAGMPEGHVLVAPEALRVCLAEPLDGAAAPGALLVRGLCWWAAAERTPAPTVTLMVNGEPLQSQGAPDPRFVIDAPRLRAGVNSVQLVARLSSGVTAFSPPQTVTRAEPSAAAVRTWHRYSVHDPAWDAGAAARLRQEGGLAGHRVGVFRGAGDATCALPVWLAGRFQVVLEARGQRPGGAPSVTVALEPEGADQVAVGAVAVRGWQSDHPMGEVTLAAGAKAFHVSCGDAPPASGQGDGTVWLTALRLDPVTEPTGVGPSATVAWPPAGHEVHEVDAVVADVRDDRLVTRADLLLDGEPTGVSVGVGPRAGSVVLPLVLRRVAPGDHTVAVRAFDDEGRGATSEPVSIHVRARAPAAPGAYHRAVRMLNRLGYGPEPDALARLLVQGEDAWLDARLRAGTDLAARGAEALAAVYFPDRVNGYHVARGALHQAIADPDPVRVRLRTFIENHFTTWIRKVEGPAKHAEHRRFAALGTAPFPDLLWASATSPTMLAYLDQVRSFAGHLNENYARELLELHTLGVDGGYAQADVTRLAALLTGWSASVDGDGVSGGRPRDLTFRFEPAANDEGPQRLLGFAFPEASGAAAFDRVRCALELLAAHPSTARFVARKLAAHVVAMPPPPALLDAMAAEFLRTHGDLAAVLRVAVRHPAFLDPALPGRLASPLDYALRLARTTGWRHPWGVGEFLDRSGMGMFDRETPDGYPEEDQAWADSNGMVQRWRLAEAARWSLVALVPPAWRYAREAMDDARRDAVVDVLAVRLTGRPLGERSHAAAVELLAGLDGNTDQRCQEIAIFVARSPEANVR